MGTKKKRFPLRVKTDLAVILMSRQQNNAFTMHSNVRFMLRKNDATMLFGSGGIRVFALPCTTAVLLNILKIIKLTKLFTKFNSL